MALVLATLPEKVKSAVRGATLADLPALVALGTEFLTTSAYVGHIQPDPDAMWRTGEQVIPGGGVFVGEQDGAVVGMIGLIAYPHPWSGERVASELFWFARPSMRGRLGVQLLTTAEQWAWDMGCSVIQMIAPDARVGMLYARRGYVPVETLFQRRKG